jgi:hypothetical protein
LRSGGVTQGIKSLLSKQEAMNSNPSATKKKKNKDWIKVNLNATNVNDNALYTSEWLNVIAQLISDVVHLYWLCGHIIFLTLPLVPT